MRHIALGWVITMPATAIVAAAAFCGLELAVRRRNRWFLPETPDVLGLLRRQVAVTIDGMDAFAAWAAGDEDAAAAVRELEHRADDAKRELQAALREAFVTPLEPEDLFALSRGIDRILNQAKDLVRESEVMACPPDTPLAGMSAHLAESLRALDEAIERLGPGTGDADRGGRRRDQALPPSRAHLSRGDGRAARGRRPA